MLNIQEASHANNDELFLSVIVPVKNEEGNIAPLIAEIAATFEKSNKSFEMIFVDDGSTDSTPIILKNLRGTYENLRILQHKNSSGQSAAIRSGVFAANGKIIATLDGDGQNNPVFLPKMLEILESDEKIGIVQGQRMARKDGTWKKYQSKIANIIRGFFLNDHTKDTGCGLKLFPKEVYVRLPYFDALHRFMPALVQREGFKIAHIDVIDRPRGSGISNYGFLGRLKVGIIDLFGVFWLIKRKKPTPQPTEIL